ncbi:BQ5605_C004g02719 [Microbotryum silenes-dioicae]|uniref:BQ5605_C004g02719 protein n=1 Tax=Microbotryum silenes-dioicae TaxID=796604 RepID=A0A2X0MBV9_9BASI|nr:BQ5605_C004g02719 [Microbotryum silenes-dioicae]
MSSTSGDDHVQSPDPTQSRDVWRPPNERKRDRDAPPPIPSIYELLPSLPQLAPATQTLSSKHQRSTEMRKLEHLARVFDIGPAADALTRHLEAEAKRLHQIHSVVRKSAPKYACTRSGTSGENETDQDGLSRNDETEARDGGDEQSDTAAPSGGVGSPEKARKRAKPQSRTWSKRRRLAIPNVPKVDDVNVRVPPDKVTASFGLQSLLSSLHSHVSRRLAASYNIVLPLTIDEPFQSPSVLQHFEELHADEFASEERCFEMASERQWKKFKKALRANPLSTSQKVVGWKKEWRNADRAFEDSALVAMGILLKLHARDLCQNPERIMALSATSGAETDDDPSSVPCSVAA